MVHVQCITQNGQGQRIWKAQKHSIVRYEQSHSKDVPTSYKLKVGTHDMCPIVCTTTGDLPRNTLGTGARIGGNYPMAFQASPLSVCRSSNCV